MGYALKRDRDLKVTRFKLLVAKCVILLATGVPIVINADSNNRRLFYVITETSIKMSQLIQAPHTHKNCECF